MTVTALARRSRGRGSEPWIAALIPVALDEDGTPGGRQAKAHSNVIASSRRERSNPGRPACGPWIASSAAPPRDDDGEGGLSARSFWPISHRAPGRDAREHADRAFLAAGKVTAPSRSCVILGKALLAPALLRCAPQ